MPLCQAGRAPSSRTKSRVLPQQCGIPLAWTCCSPSPFLSDHILALTLHSSNMKDLTDWLQGWAHLQTWPSPATVTGTGAHPPLVPLVREDTMATDPLGLVSGGSGRHSSILPAVKLKGLQEHHWSLLLAKPTSLHPTNCPSSPFSPPRRSTGPSEKLMQALP